MKKNIEIDKNLREMAKNTAARIENAQERKRAYALATGALALAKALQSDGFGVSFKHSLLKFRRLPEILSLPICILEMSESTSE